MDLLVDLLLNFPGPTAYLLVFGVLLACGLGVPIPEDITLFAAGIMAYYGIVNVYWMVGISFLGVLLGDSICWYLGDHVGRRATQIWLFRKLLREDHLNAARARFKKRGDKLLFAARFMPGLRAPIFFSAGMLHVPYRRFILYDGSAALISVPAIVGAVYYFGDELDRVIRVIKRIEHGIFGVLLVAILLVAAKWYWTRRRARRVAA